MWLDRVASPALLESLKEGACSWITTAVRSQAAPGMLDLRFRCNRRLKRSEAVLYLGERATLRIHEAAGTVVSTQPTRPLMSISPEGRVQAALSSRLDHAVLDRECAFRFDGQDEKDRTLKSVAGNLRAVMKEHAASRKLPEPPALGQELDALAIGDDGVLEVIEIKSRYATGAIGWAPAQVGFYARMFDRWLGVDPNALETLRLMANQRVELGLARAAKLVEPIRVRAVIAVGEPLKNPPVARDRAEALQADLLARDVGWSDLEARAVRRDGATAPLNWF